MASSVVNPGVCPGTSQAGAPASSAVDVWWTRLDRPFLPIDALHRSLDEDEQRRAAMMSGEARRRYIFCHGLLRWILAGYTGQEAASLAFTHGPSGKPKLTGVAADGVSFSLAHGRGLALVAVTGGDDVGVDLEQRSRWREIRQIAGQVFSPEERALLATLGGEDLQDALVRGWVRKEALLKAAGDGMTLRMSAVASLFDPDRAICLPGSEARWRVVDVGLPDPEWLAAIAIIDSGAPVDVTLRAWPVAESA